MRRDQTTLFDTFPSAAMHAGDFSELLNLSTPIAIHDPFNRVTLSGQCHTAE